jgi:hypothetical protein
MAHRVISLPRSNWVAFGVKRTSTRAGRRTGFMSTRPSLMDADGDGTVSLQEWQAAHERIFKAMDTDHDGTVTFEEMQAFMLGVGPASHH